MYSLHLAHPISAARSRAFRHGYVLWFQRAFLFRPIACPPKLGIGGDSSARTTHPRTEVRNVDQPGSYSLSALNLPPSTLRECLGIWVITAKLTPYPAVFVRNSKNRKLCSPDESGEVGAPAPCESVPAVGFFTPQGLNLLG